MSKILINYDGKIKTVRNYHKRVFWKKDFNMEVLNLCKKVTHFSKHLVYDYLAINNKTKVKNEHDFTLDDINKAWQKIIKHDMEILECGFDCNGKCVAGMMRVNNIDNEHDFFIVVWACDNGIYEIHTCYKVLSKYRYTRDINTARYDKR